ncbi:hypothetical protein HYV81_04610 [Candidatus Woesearchaeota archaeon]|nr:hypothetical protein [Candidatus Woesearchaeota archaeon]
MDKKRLIDTIGIILLFIGMFYAFLPHALHGVVLGSLDDESSHLKHVVVGITLVVVSLGMLVYSNRRLDDGKKRNIRRKR